MPAKSAKPRKTADISDKPLQVVEPDRWERFIGLVADGVYMTTALKEVGIGQYTFHGKILTNPEMKAQYEDAKILAGRMVWPIERVERVCGSIAMGQTLAEIARDEGFDQGSFYTAVMRDPVAKEFYEQARQIQMECWSDDMIVEADNDSSDETIDGKPNSAAVRRSEVKIKTRQWIMARLAHRRFGDRMQQEVEHTVVNHAEKLDAARRRKEKAINQTRRLENQGADV